MIDQYEDDLLEALHPETPQPKRANRDLKAITKWLETNGVPQEPDDPASELIDQIVIDIDRCYWTDAEQDANKMCKAVEAQRA